MIQYVSFEVASNMYLDNLSTTLMTNPKNEINYRICLSIREKLGFVSPVEIGDILIANQTSYIWPINNGDRFKVITLGEVFTISLFLPGNTEKTSVRLQYLTVKNLDTNELSSPLICLDYLLSPKPVLPKDALRALVVNHKMQHRPVEEKTPDYLNPFLSPALLRYGYSQTGHKLQGSETDTLIMVVRSVAALRETNFGRRYAYTACTRARKKLVIVETLWA